MDVSSRRRGTQKHSCRHRAHEKEPVGVTSRLRVGYSPLCHFVTCSWEPWKPAAPLPQYPDDPCGLSEPLPGAA